MSNTFFTRQHGFDKLNNDVLNKRKPQADLQLSPELAALLARLAQKSDPSTESENPRCTHQRQRAP